MLPLTAAPLAESTRRHSLEEVLDLLRPEARSAFPARGADELPVQPSHTPAAQRPSRGSDPLGEALTKLQARRQRPPQPDQATPSSGSPQTPSSTPSSTPRPRSPIASATSAGRRQNTARPAGQAAAWFQPESAEAPALPEAQTEAAIDTDSPQAQTAASNAQPETKPSAFSHADRRGLPRRRARSGARVRIVCRSENTKREWQFHSAAREGELVDLCLTGAAILCSAPYEIGQRLQLRFEAPRTGEAYDRNGRVVRLIQLDKTHWRVVCEMDEEFDHQQLAALSYQVFCNNLI